MDTNIVKVARRTRRWAMRNRDKFDIWSDLGGMCAIASAKLFRNLQAEGIPAELHVAVARDYCAHVYVVVNGHIVDITATQFSEKHSAVLITERSKETRSKWWWQSTHKFQTVEALVAYQLKAGWPTEQIPSMTGVSVDVRLQTATP